MKYTVQLREEAELDLSDAATWYELQQIGLGHQFLGNVSSLLHSIPEHPLQYPTIHKNIRRALLPQFPFGIYYSIEESYIIVYAVMHASRHPIRWQDRT